MKIRFALRLAWNNIRKNARLYVPNMLTGTGLTAVLYIMLTLSFDERLRNVKGGSYLTSIMPLGLIVVSLLSLILILYINSFVMKQRNREFGLYNVLGMEKRHITRILFWETAINAGLVVLFGLISGVVLYKLCTLLICKVLRVDSILGVFFVSPVTLLPSAAFILGVYFLAFLSNSVRIARMNPMELLQSTHTGEKEPRIKWVLLVIGLLTLGAGYYLSITTKDPLEALLVFFAAVILVIIGTYCLFVTGTIAILKLLKSKKDFYYKKKNMIAVSGLLYRMKQNAVGLASICILATMVLIMVSTTVSLYAGVDDTIEQLYTHQVYLSASTIEEDTEKYNKVPDEVILDCAYKAASKFDLEIQDTDSISYFFCELLCSGGQFSTSETLNLFNTSECYFITAEQYEKQIGQPIHLAENEIAYCPLQTNNQKMGDTIAFNHLIFNCTQKLETYPIRLNATSVLDNFGFVVANDAVIQQIIALIDEQNNSSNTVSERLVETLVLDFTDEKAASEHYKEFIDVCSGLIVESLFELKQYAGIVTSIDCKWGMYENLLGVYGTFLFLGLILSVVFLFSTTLIIYYKQISEGYEDRERFQIMQKVGMNGDEVAQTIRTQILLVFFLPLLVAALHVAFAFPILLRLLRVLFLTDQSIFMAYTFLSLGVFAALYILIYRLTARTYYHIVK